MKNSLLVPSAVTDKQGQLEAGSRNEHWYWDLYISRSLHTLQSPPGLTGQQNTRPNGPGRVSQMPDLARPY